jgi:alkylhydroperoxidase/carboxymuconolactone decarboxylase family protein YurZ
MSTAEAERKKRLRDEFIEARGYWNEFWDSLLDLDEEFFAAYTSFSSVPWRHGPLDPKIKEFVYIAVDAAATHLYVPGIRQHVRQAISYGATAQEIMEVLELTATLGIHACNIGVPILLEELEAAGQPVPRELSARQEEIKAEFTAKRGYWNAFWDEMLILDPEFFAAYTQFSSVPRASGTL